MVGPCNIPGCEGVTWFAWDMGGPREATGGPCMPEYGGLGGAPAWGGNPAAVVGGGGPEWNGEGCDAGGMAAGY